MARLIYFATLSLDGYMADTAGNFDWAAPDGEVHAFVNDRLRGVGTFLFGRRMYETMAVWENPEIVAAQPAFVRDFEEIWRQADKIVYSTTLDAVATGRTRLERAFDAAAVSTMKREATAGITVGGANLAEHALRAGVVDELELFVVPAIVGAGLAALPHDLRVSLRLLDERRFGNGTVYLRYRIG